MSYTQNRRGAIQTKKVIDYIPWLRHQLENEENSVLKRLAEGHNFEAISYNAYAINGYVFCMVDVEMNKTTQNSGVSMNVVTSFRASARDKNLEFEEVTYYGIAKQILELNYYDFKVVVFNCDWVRIEDASGLIVDLETNLAYVNLRTEEVNEKYKRRG